MRKSKVKEPNLKQNIFLKYNYNLMVGYVRKMKKIFKKYNLTYIVDCRLEVDEYTGFLTGTKENLIKFITKTIMVCPYKGKPHLLTRKEAEQEIKECN